MSAISPSPPRPARPPLPLGLAKALPSPSAPWLVSDALFGRIKSLRANGTFRVCTLEASDLETAFVIYYFQSQPPPNRGIKSIKFVHNAVLSQGFEANLKSMEAEAGKLNPTWQGEEPKEERQRTMTRWKSAIAQFPVVVVDKRQPLTQAKVLPLWHGTRRPDDICSDGFAIIGKHHYFDSHAKPGNSGTTDIGFFGSGIYLTNSPQYASMYGSHHLLLAFVSMIEPYPVVNDVPNPREGSDMTKLKGHGAYQRHNAHYIPVTSVNPSDPSCMIFHPCYKSDTPKYDEYVVFNKFQALPCFWVELEVMLPKAMSDSGGGKGKAVVAKDPVTAVALPQFVFVPTPSAQPPGVKTFHSVLKDPATAVALPQFVFVPTPSAQPPGVKTFHSVLMEKKSDNKTDSHAAASKLEMKQFEAGGGSLSMQDVAKAAKLFSSIDPLHISGPQAPTIASVVGNTVLTPAQVLLKAASEGDSNRLAALLSERKYIELLETRDDQNRTPLLLAVKSGSLKACEVLVGAGASIYATDNEGSNVLHLSLLFLPLLSFFFDKTNAKALLESRNNAGLTPFLTAVLHHGKTERNALLTAGAKFEATDSKNNNVLHLVGGKGDVETMRELLGDRRAKALLENRGAGGFTPLLVSGKNVGCFTLLLEVGADISAKTQDDFNVLHVAAMSDDVETIQFILTDRRGRAFLETKTKWGATPLLLSAGGANRFVCEALLQAGAGMNVTDSHGKNVLHYGAENPNAPVLSVFLADPRSRALLEMTESLFGMTPLLHGASWEWGGGVSCKLLLDAGANIRAVDQENNNVLHLASKQKTGKALAILMADRRMRDLLEAKNKSGETPLLTAVLRKSTDNCQMLIAAGAKVEATDNRKRNILHCALNSSEMVKFLLINPAIKRFINVQDGEGRTPLFAAVTSEYYHSSIPFLLEQGADRNIPNKAGKKPLQEAERRGFRAVVTLLS